MKINRQYKQETIVAQNPLEFDTKMNKIFSTAGKDVDIHYFDSIGLCATVRFWSEEFIPESISEKYELIGEKHYCKECRHYSQSNDKRVKKVLCEVNTCLVTQDTCVCDVFYSERGLS